MDRRHFLTTTAAGAAALAAPGAFALGERSKLGIGLLKHGGGYRDRPRSVEQLMWEVTKQTSINARERPILVDATSPKLFQTPLLVWIGTGATAPMSDEARQRLRRFLLAGGTLFIDDATVPGDDSFDESARREMEALMPDTPVSVISNDHTIYRSFFLLQEPFGRVKRKGHLEGTPFDDRCPIIYNRNDLFGAFGRDTFGQWLMPVVPGGAMQRERAFRLGINLLMYATCLNYKRDQVHVTAILRRRRWRVDRPNGPTR